MSELLLLNFSAQVVWFVVVTKVEDRCCCPLIFRGRSPEWGVMRNSLVCITQLQDWGYLRSRCVAGNLMAQNTHHSADYIHTYGLNISGLTSNITGWPIMF